MQLTYAAGQYHMDHQSGHTTYRASSHGVLGAMAGAMTRLASTVRANMPHTIRVWFIVDATVDTHLLLSIAGQPLHKATESTLGTQALLLSKTLQRPPNVQLRIVK